MSPDADRYINPQGFPAFDEAQARRAAKDAAGDHSLLNDPNTE